MKCVLYSCKVQELSVKLFHRLYHFVIVLLTFLHFRVNLIFLLVVSKLYFREKTPSNFQEKKLAHLDFSRLLDLLKTSIHARPNTVSSSGVHCLEGAFAFLLHFGRQQISSDSESVSGTTSGCKWVPYCAWVWVWDWNWNGESRRWPNGLNSFSDWDWNDIWGWDWVWNCCWDWNCG